METPSLDNKEIARILRFMYRHDSIYKAGEALMAGDYARLGSGNLHLSILERHVTGDVRACLLSAEALKFLSLTPDQRITAEDILIEVVESRYYPRMIQGLVRHLVITACLAAILMLILLFTTMGAGISGLSLQSYSYLVSWTIVVMAVGAFTFLFIAAPLWSLIVSRRALLRLRQVSAETLGRWGGPASIDVLVSTRAIASLWASSGPSLRRVLQRLGPHDYGRVESASASGLAVFFSPQFNLDKTETWTPAVLDALAIVGDGDCVEIVENAINNGLRPEWRAHAADVLAILVERQRFERDSTQLLRPAGGKEAVNLLLRPLPASNEPVQNLLRPAGEDEI